MGRGSEQGTFSRVASRGRDFDAAVAGDYSRLYGAPVQEPDRLIFIDKPHQLAYKLPLNSSGDRQNLNERGEGELLDIGETRVLRTAAQVVGAADDRVYRWEDLISDLREAGIPVISETLPV